MGGSRRQHWNSAILAAGICGWLLAGCHRPKPASNPPNVEALRVSLERSAAAALPAPSLVNQRLLIAAKPGEVDAKAKEVTRIGDELGATVLPGASSNPAQSGTTLLFRLPEERVGEFSRRVQASSSETSAAAKSTNSIPQFDTHLDNPVESALVEVAIEPKEPPGQRGMDASSPSENRGGPGPRDVHKNDGTSLPLTGAEPEATP